MDESVSAPAPEQVSVAKLPEVLERRLTNLDDWADANKRDAKWDGFRFWGLKLPAILVSASSGFLAGYKPDVAKIAGIVAGVCVVLDGLLRTGALRSVHLRAVAEIRTLQNDISAQWSIGSLRKEDLSQLTARIIESSEKEKKRIAAYLQTAETAMPAAAAVRATVRGRAKNKPLANSPIDKTSEH